MNRRYEKVSSFILTAAIILLVAAIVGGMIALIINGLFGATAAKWVFAIVMILLVLAMTFICLVVPAPDSEWERVLARNDGEVG